MLVDVVETRSAWTLGMNNLSRWDSWVELNSVVAVACSGPAVVGSRNMSEKMPGLLRGMFEFVFLRFVMEDDRLMRTGDWSVRRGVPIVWF